MSKIETPIIYSCDVCGEKIDKHFEIYSNNAVVGKEIYGQKNREGYAHEKIFFCAKLTIEIDKKDFDVCDKCLKKIKTEITEKLNKE